MAKKGRPVSQSGKVLYRVRIVGYIDHPERKLREKPVVGKRKAGKDKYFVRTDWGNVKIHVRNSYFVTRQDAEKYLLQQSKRFIKTKLFTRTDGSVQLVRGNIDERKRSKKFGWGLRKGEAGKAERIIGVKRIKFLKIRKGKQVLYEKIKVRKDLFEVRMLNFAQDMISGLQAVENYDMYEVRNV